MTVLKITILHMTLTCIGYADGKRIVAAIYEPYKSQMRSASHPAFLQTFVNLLAKELSASMHTQGVRLNPRHKAFDQGVEEESSIRVSRSDK